MEIKIVCDCGTNYKFDVEPVNGRMPAAVACPDCSTNGTFQANEIIARSLGGTAVATPVALPTAPAAPRIAVTMREPATTSSAPGHAANNSLLGRSTFFVKERVAMLKLVDTYDILDPASQQPIGLAKEVVPIWITLLRFVVNKGMLPTTVRIYESEDRPPVASIHRGFTLLRSKIQVVSGDGRPLGYFKSKILSLGGGFNVFNNADQQVAEVKGNWKGWDFKFIAGGREIGSVTKKWAGLGRELFTSADNYMISLTDVQLAGPDTAALLLAAGLAIDIVFKESK